jgi:hypothetical protein
MRHDSEVKGECSIPCATEAPCSFLITTVPGHFAERHFAERHFAERHFAERTFCRRTSCRTDILPNGHFAERTFCRTDSLPKGQLAENRDVIS